MSLNSQNHERLWALIEQAYALAPEEREAFWIREEAAQPELARLARAAVQDGLSLSSSTLGSERQDSSSAHNAGSTPPLAELREQLSGEVIDGRFELGEPIGHGGMGVVFRARHRELDQSVAIKVLPAGRGREDVVREGRRIAEVSHPNVVRVIDVGLHGDLPYLVMEWLDGFDLRAWLQMYHADGGHQLVRLDEVFARFAADRFGPGNGLGEASGSYWRFVASTLRDVARAAGFAHGLSIVHQDIAPKNIMVTAEGRPALIDFGLANLRKIQAGDEPASQVFGGTLPYMAPEHRRSVPGHSLELNDVYGLGATLLHLACGQSPETVALPATGFRKPLQFASIPGRSYTVPLDLLRIAWKAMRPEPEDRYPSALAMAEDLDCFLRFSPISVGRAGIGRTLKLLWRRSPAKASLLVLAPIAGYGAVDALHGNWVAAQEVAREARWEQISRLYASLPIDFVLGVNASARLGSYPIENDKTYEKLNRLLGFLPARSSLRVRRLLHAARRGDMETVETDLEHLAGDHPDSVVLPQLAPLLRDPDPEVRHALVPYDELQPPVDYLDLVWHAVWACSTRAEDEVAYEHARQALDQDPSDFVMRELRARALVYGWQDESGLREVRRIESLLGSETNTTLHLRAFTLNYNHPQEAADIWRTVLNSHPDSYQALHNLALHDLREGSPALALERVEQLITQRALAPEIHGLMADCMRALDRHEEASARLQTTLQLWQAGGNSTDARSALETTLAYHLTHQIRQRHCEGTLDLESGSIQTAAAKWQMNLEALPATASRLEHEAQLVFLEMLIGRVTPQESMAQLKRLQAMYHREYRIEHKAGPQGSPWIAEAYLLAAQGQDLRPEQVLEVIESREFCRFHNEINARALTLTFPTVKAEAASPHPMPTEDR